MCLFCLNISALFAMSSIAKTITKIEQKKGKPLSTHFGIPLVTADKDITGLISN